MKTRKTKIYEHDRQKFPSWKLSRGETKQTGTEKHTETVRRHNQGIQRIKNVFLKLKESAFPVYKKQGNSFLF